MNIEFCGMFRNGGRVYTKRPPSNCYSARRAWDSLLKDGPIVSMLLIDGYWSCERPNGDIDDRENIYWLDKRKRDAGMY